jgi:lipopolysaccharide/colanic/teichoic acid biosynthesis glycosyltransferase
VLLLRCCGDNVGSAALEGLNKTKVAVHLLDIGRVTKGGSLPMNSSTNIINIAPGLCAVSEPKVPYWKAPLDLLCIMVTLPLWLPLMILLMLITRIASPGPIFYRQRRVGLGGRHFSIWKFRTMKVNSDTLTHEHYFEELMRVNCPMTKLDSCGDPRLTPFGKFLRASGLDELPQIFNVLCGEMSLVGPRPCLPNEFAKYEPWQRQRVNTLPGLTGFWQVNGKNKTTFNQMVAMDLFYARNISILLDLKIMLRTGETIVEQLWESRVGSQLSRNGGSPHLVSSIVDREKSSYKV